MNYYDILLAKKLAENEGGGGSSVEVEPLSVTENGTYTAEQSKAFSPVTVNVPNPSTGTLSISANGTYDVTNYASADVSVSGLAGWTTDGIAEKSQPNGDITISSAVTTIKQRAFSDFSGITSVTLEGNPYISNYAFEKCTNMTKFNAPNLTSLKASIYTPTQYSFQECSKLEGIVLPSFGNSVVDSYNFQKCTLLSYADFNNLQRFGASVFYNTNISTLVIRKTDDVAGLSNINSFNNTPFASGGTGGTLYVPNALISSYQTASNWSTILGYANNQIKAIENSYYETHYADGTPIGA